MAAKIKKGDKVVVLSGRDKGKTGEVIKSIPAESRVIVQGVNMVKRHNRPAQGSPGHQIRRGRRWLRQKHISRVYGLGTTTRSGTS